MMNKIRDRLRKDLKAKMMGDPDIIINTLKLIFEASYTDDLHKSSIITERWLKCCIGQVGTHMVLHILDHECNGIDEMIKDVCEKFEDELRSMVYDGCKKIGLNNPLEKKSHNQKIYEEIIKENENG